ncbi:VOC family protein [Sphingomonas solaris]|uniref:VOC family protein n=1 Tax=Alterirhizorhabdus solaris TaxID=2529389 RepID=A0A558RCK7_9SPHN|nr:VOC family protein [Sphingomonas solaris]TVV77205.1 VOC family protein [Sphingomonas solaris]
MPRLLVNIDVPDLAAAEAFYTQGLGFVPGRRFGTAVTELTGGETPLYLIARPERDYARHWTPMHLDLVVDDLEAAAAQAEAAGAVPEGGLCSAGYGRIATFADPFGHGFCLIQFSAEGYDAIAD